MGTTETKTLCERAYQVYAPTGIGASAPLVISLHPALSNYTTWATSVNALDSTLNDAADRGLFYVCYPQGTGRVSTFASWNVKNGIELAYAEQARVNDIGFIKHLIEQLLEDYSIDSTKVYLCGFSNGAMLSYSYISTYPEDIAGVVTAAGALCLDHDECVSSIPVPIKHIHGDADINVPIAGGVGSLVTFFYPALASTKTFFESKGATFTRIDLSGADHDFDNIEAALSSQHETSFAEVVEFMVGNIVMIDSFETFDSGLPANGPYGLTWTKTSSGTTVTQSTDNVEHGTYSCRIQGTGTQAYGLVTLSGVDLTGCSSVKVILNITSMPSTFLVFRVSSEAGLGDAVSDTTTLGQTGRVELEVSLAGITDITDCKFNISNASVNGTYDYYIDKLIGITA